MAPCDADRQGNVFKHVQYSYCSTPQISSYVKIMHNWKKLKSKMFCQLGSRRSREILCSDKIKNWPWGFRLFNILPSQKKNPPKSKFYNKKKLRPSKNKLWIKMTQNPSFLSFLYRMNIARQTCGIHHNKHHVCIVLCQRHCLMMAYKRRLDCISGPLTDLAPPVKGYARGCNGAINKGGSYRCSRPAFWPRPSVMLGVIETSENPLF